MSTRSDNQVKVSFPAHPRFRRLGRVTVAGLALRLGFDVARVENLRTAVDRAAAALGDTGRVVVEAAWRDDLLELTLTNTSASLKADQQDSLAKELLSYCDDSEVSKNRVQVRLNL